MDIIGCMQTPIGRLKLILNEERRLTRICPNVSPPSDFRNPSVLEAACTQLEEYFAGRRNVFALPLHFDGTSFEMRVWKALSKIPYGETRSYQEIAAVYGNPKAVRAVGQAVHRNPLPIVVPCHRVIGSSGNLVGYAHGLSMKAFLLRLEGALFEKGICKIFPKTD